ncbi:MAG: hypothetical protein AAFO77_12650 [Pseudomonadota bacterium]
MNQIPPSLEETQEEKPLDPAVERVRTKMVRLLAVSMGVMFVSIFAVLAAVIYRINSDVSDTLVRAQIAVPPGFEILESGVSDDGVFLRGNTVEGDIRLLIFNAETGNLVRELTVIEASEAPSGG